MRWNFPKTTGSHFLLAFEMFFINLVAYQFINSNLALLQLIATATLFLASKSGEPYALNLNNVLRASCEIFHKQVIAFLSYLFPTVKFFIASPPTPSKKIIIIIRIRIWKKKFGKLSLNVKGTEMSMISHKNFYKICQNVKTILWMYDFT